MQYTIVTGMSGSGKTGAGIPGKGCGIRRDGAEGKRAKSWK